MACAIGVLLLRQDPYVNPDSQAFEAIARSLIAGHGFVYHEPMFPSVPLYAFRSPGYSAFLALGLLLGGAMAAVALQGALQGVGAALLADLVGQWAGRRAAWIAFALRLAWPAGWFHAGQLTSESFFEFTLILTLWLAMRAGARRSLTWAAAAGVMATVSMLTRPTGLGPVAVIALWLARGFPRGAIALVVAALLVWLPWPVRNYARLQTFVPLQTMGGVASYDSHSEQPPDVAWAYMAQHPELGEVGFDRHFARAAVEIVRNDPLAFVRREAWATLQYLGPIRDRRQDMWLHRFALLALLPAVWLPDWRRRLAMPAMVWASFGALLIPIVVNVRYRFPSEWCVVAAAAMGIAAAWDRWGGRRAAAFAAAGLAASIVFTLAIRRP